MQKPKLGSTRSLRYRAVAMKRILFLFNHDAAHQVAHLARVAAIAARLNDTVHCIVGYSSRAIRAQVERLIEEQDRPKLEWKQLDVPAGFERIAELFDRLFPASRLLRLRANRELFESVDAVVSTERTCLRIKSKLRRDKTPLFIRLPHGAGDRNVTFHPQNAQFDAILVPGPKAVEQLCAHGVEREKIQIVGYPKFDLARSANRSQFFDNDRPTFVYNPHFDPNLSSWYDAGPELLRWFAGPEGQAFNCIFAPHVMLFRKAVHVSPEYRMSRRRPEIPRVAIEADNIRIDTGSERLFDMSYTLASDGYIGDASSQIYEFLIEPRPVFFFDLRRKRLAGDEHWMVQWRAGPKVRSVEEMVKLLPDYQAIGRQYCSAQGKLFAYTFDRGEIPASERAARAIVKLVCDQDR